MANDFEEWITRGPGEAMLGEAIKAAAAAEKRRLSQQLTTPNLFPHIEHEQRVALERAEYAYKVGKKMAARGRHRNAVIKAMAPPSPDRLREEG